jgi:mannosylglycerate hydrolase
VTRPTTVAIVPHTHWDREWYAPFQVFRARLVALLDELLPLLERDLSYAHFLLDGQTVVLDDYLEIRPEAAATVQDLAASGRVSMGPWMVLPDEYMVSGETLVRNLQLGMARAHELGGALPVGYLPDMFGHVAQLPQLLRLAGLEHAVVWRGVPSAIDRTAFWWEAPDGSRVRAEYLYGSYSNGRDLPDDAKQLIARARSYQAELGPARLSGGALLLMNGTDHQLPQPGLGRVVTEANSIQADYRFVVTSLAAHVATQPVDGLPRWRGELRSGARANVLMGVASNRVDVHQACAAAERALERGAEPLNALFLPAERYPHGLLAVAWRQLVLNSAHDSSCACSADDVVDQVLVRYREARQLSDELTRPALRHLATEVDVAAGTTIVVNPTAHERGGVVEGTLPGTGPVHFVGPDGADCPTELVRELGGEGFATVVTGQKIRWVLDLMRGPEFAGVRIRTAETRQLGDDDLEVVLHGAGPDDASADLEELREELLALADTDTTFRVRMLRAPARVVRFAVDPVPGFGWRAFRVVEGDGPTSPVTAVADAEGTVAMTNGVVGVAIDHLDGTFTLSTTDHAAAGLGRLVDGGDGGDTYNYSPPAIDGVVDSPEAVRVAILVSGPVMARVLVERDYQWPTHAVGDERSCARRADENAAVTITTTLELRHGERFVRVRTELDHNVRDHRLRAHFPLPTRVTGSDAECAFAVVHRGLDAEGGPHEAALPTFVSRRFVDCSDGYAGLAVLHDGLLEYEVVEDGSELALTLLRATGYLSRLEPALRPNPAGPPMPLVGAQLPGHQRFEYALLLHGGDWRAADLYAAADEFLVPLERVRGGGVRGAFRPPTGERLAVRGAPVSAVRRDRGGLMLRVFNPEPDPVTVEVEDEGAPATGWVVDLIGHPQAPFEGNVRLRPGEIATLRLAERGR